MSDPRAIDGDFDSATGSSAEKVDTDADSSSTGDVAQGGAGGQPAPGASRGGRVHRAGDGRHGFGGGRARRRRGRRDDNEHRLRLGRQCDNHRDAVVRQGQECCEHQPDERPEQPATGKDPSTSPTSGLSGLATGKDPSTSPTSGLSGLATGKDPSTSPTSGLSGLATGKEPSTISGSEDDDLEDLEVQRGRTVRGGATEATSASAAGMGDDFVAGVRGSPARPVMDEGIVFADTGRPRGFGMPDLRPGAQVSIAGAGDPFFGDASVSAANHAIGDAGYNLGGGRRRGLRFMVGHGPARDCGLFGGCHQG